MKRALPWLVVLLLVLGAAWLGWMKLRPQPALVVPVDLAQHDGETIDFSSGKPVVKNTPADRAALEKAAQEMAEAAKSVTFEPPKKKAEPKK